MLTLAYVFFQQCLSIYATKNLPKKAEFHFNYFQNITCIEKLNE